MGEFADGVRAESDSERKSSTIARRNERRESYNSNMKFERTNTWKPPSLEEALNSPIAQAARERRLRENLEWAEKRMPKMSSAFLGRRAGRLLTRFYNLQMKAAGQ